MVETVEHGGAPVELDAGGCRRDRPLDGERPQHAGVDAVGMGVGERGDRCREAGNGVAVAEVSKGDWSGAHQRPVAGRLGASALMFLRRLGGVGPSPARRAEHGPRLRADIGRAALEPAHHRLADLVGVGGSVGQHREHGDRHLRVVRPLARCPPERSAALELARCVRVRRAELVRRAHRVARRRGEHRPDRPIDHRCARRHRQRSSPSLYPPQKSSRSRTRAARVLPRHAETVRLRPPYMASTPAASGWKLLTLPACTPIVPPAR